MIEKKSFYITTTLPYVNSDPHIGFGMEIIRADVIARFKKKRDFDVFFNTGTDEHGQKIWQKAQEQGGDTQTYVDKYAKKFKELIPLLGISDDINFIRTTDGAHEKAAQEFWKRCEESGDIYKKNYVIKYCVGCELEKTDSELEHDKCAIHPNLDLEIREEENYFFRFSKYQKPLLDFYSKNPNFVIPDFRFNEIKAFVERGLEDFSISRLKEKMPWGVSVPDDNAHVMYVWFDALVSYISTLGWPDDGEKFTKYWRDGLPTQYAGKDNLRQQSAMWQAMLLSADLPLSKNIIINGFITSRGQKMSKSLGNVINPIEVVEKYNSETLRYFVCRELSNFEDSDFTFERLNESYNSGLANGLGNLVSRTIKMAVTYDAFPKSYPEKEELMKDSYTSKFLEKFEIKNAIDKVWENIASVDKFIQDEKPFQEIKINPEKAAKDVEFCILEIYRIAWELSPFMPETSEKIINSLEMRQMPPNLFPRKDEVH